MGAVLLICAGLLGASPPDRAEYQAAAARAGKDAGAHVKLAVWCEAHGMDAERLKHLAVALALDPQNAAARGLMGLVSYGGRWLPPDKVGETVNADEALAAKLAEYEAKRQATPQNAEAQWQLALWCEKNGLRAEAMAHFTAVTQIDPKRSDAWHKLGCEFRNGRWINAEQAAAERTEDEAQWKADMHWKPILVRWQRDLNGGGARRERAVAVLNAISDPRAVPSIHRVLARGNRVEQEMAALMFSRIPCAASSHALLGLSLFDSWHDGRAFAIRELKRRDPREYMDELIGLLHRPFEFHVNQPGPTGGPTTLVIDGEKRRIERVYQPVGAFTRNPRRPAFAPAGAVSGMTPIGPLGPVATDRFLGNPAAGFMDPARFGQQAAGVVPRAQVETQRTMQREIAVVERFNAGIRTDNQKVAATLSEITGETLGDDPDAWLKWWNDKLGLRYERVPDRYKETTTQYVPIRFQVHHACFAAGTPVSTLTGPRPIESLEVGDQVLSQDTETGILGYQPIVGVHHNPPAETVRIRLKGETVVSTPVHRFWRAGRGWAMARDLNPGDSVRTASGRAEVIEIRPEAVQPVYNLDVARTHSFFVGSGRLLVRDNSLPPPTFTRFDAEPDLAALVEEPGEPSEQGEGVNQPSPASESMFRPGSIWDSPAGSFARPRASNPAPRTTGTGSIWDSPGGSSTRSKESSPGLHRLESNFRSPR